MAGDTDKPSATRVREYYDDFSKGLMRDYVLGNRRSSLAIDAVCSLKDVAPRSILDFGCGIGVSSAAYSKRFPNAHTLGVDIGMRNIEFAKALFESSNVKFERISADEPEVNGEFDLIALLDVYEHISRDTWQQFNSKLGEWLSDKGTVFLSTPTRLHQEYLSRHAPDSLQIIDETVFLRDIANLSDELGADVVSYKYVDVWQTNQYVHVVLQRSPKYEKAPSTGSRLGKDSWGVCSRIASWFPWTHAAGVRGRRKHLWQQLGIRV